MKKILKSTLILALAFALIMGISVTTNAANNGWTWRQETVHEIAELARKLGLSENHPLIAVCSDLWWADHDGRDASSIGSYYSNRTNQTYYGTTSANFYGNGGNYGTNYTNGYRGASVYEQGYTWTWDNGSQQYYRWSNGTRIWLDGRSGNQTNNTTSNGISFRWDGYQWYQTQSGEFYRWNGGTNNRSIVWATARENEKILKEGNYLGNTYYDTYGNANTRDNYSRNDQTTYWDGQYTWYWDSSSQQYYRWDGSQKIWWNNRNYSRNDQTTYWDGQYTWYWDSSSQQYYRWDGSQKIWWNNRNSQQQATYTQNNPVYTSNLFSGYNWYGGIIAGPNDDWLESQAKLLVQLTYNYVRDLQSQTKQAQFMWLALNIANGADLSNVGRDAFPKCDFGIDASSAKDSNNRLLIALARDVLFRQKAENNNWTNNGRVLPAQYTYFSISGQNITFKDQNGNVYTGTSKTPYST